MITIETLEVSGLEGAIKGMRNPFKNREVSDSGWQQSDDGDSLFNFVIGEKDMALCHKLLSGGDDDSKFLRFIHVQADINAPLYWWKEYDTYKVSTVANSESTMHTLTKREFTLEDFSYDGYSEYWESVVKELNVMRQLFLEAKAKEKGSLEAYEYWRQMIQMLPSSYMQKRTVDLNYQTLRRIFKARKNHRLNEWNKGFIDWMATLPYAEELIMYEPPKTVTGIDLKKFFEERQRLRAEGMTDEEIANHFCMYTPFYRLACALSNQESF